jgi:hypothetical protein
MKNPRNKSNSGFEGHPFEREWRAEIRRRLAEIDSGKVEPIDGKVVSARMAKIVGRRRSR